MLPICSPRELPLGRELHCSHSPPQSRRLATLLTGPAQVSSRTSQMRPVQCVAFHRRWRQRRCHLQSRAPRPVRPSCGLVGSTILARLPARLAVLVIPIPPQDEQHVWHWIQAPSLGLALCRDDYTFHLHSPKISHRLACMISWLL